MSSPRHIVPAADLQTMLVIDGETCVPTFADEFDAEEASFWRGYGGTWSTSFSQHLEDTRTISRNGKLQYYADPDMTLLPAAFTSEGGSLSIAASPLTVEQRAHAGGLEYGSGLLTTEMSFSPASGYIEIRADVPDEVGLWSAFWLLPLNDDWTAEIDVFEFVGENTDILQTSIWSDGQPASLSIGVEGMADGFHAYSLPWKSDSIAWHYDGALVPRENVVLAKEMYLILNLAVGGWAADADTTDFNHTLSVDYIRFYELEAGTTRNPSLSEQPSSPDLRQIGSETSDLVDGSQWADLIAVSSGNHTVYGDDGNDRLLGERGDDQLVRQCRGVPGQRGWKGQADRRSGWRCSCRRRRERSPVNGNYRKDGSPDAFVFGKGCGAGYIRTGIDRIDISGLPFTFERMKAGR